MIKLSVLIPSLPSRRKTYLQRILDQIEGQINSLKRKDIEVIVLYDNKKRKIGDKRQDMLDIARGEYLVFIDDDDRVSDDYISEVMRVIDSGSSPDCIVYDTMYSRLGKNHMLCKYGIEYEYNKAVPGSGAVWTGKPAHTMVYKSSLAKSVRYSSINAGEDTDWVIRACKLIKKQERINKVLYFYENDYSETVPRDAELI